MLVWRQLKKSIIAALLVTACFWGSRVSAQTFLKPPPDQKSLCRLVKISQNPPRYRYVIDPWSTQGANPGAHAAFGFRFPTGLIQSVDAARLLETGTDSVVAGISWTSNATTTSAILGLVPVKPGQAWAGFLGSVSSSVPDNTEVDFEVEITLHDGVSESDLVAYFCANQVDQAFSDGADSLGNLTNTLRAFVDVAPQDAADVCVPTLSGVGIAAMVAILGSASVLVLRRTRTQRHGIATAA